MIFGILVNARTIPYNLPAPKAPEALDPHAWAALHQAARTPWPKGLRAALRRLLHRDPVDDALIADVARLAQVAPHLLDDIGIEVDLAPQMPPGRAASSRMPFGAIPRPV